MNQFFLQPLQIQFQLAANGATIEMEPLKAAEVKYCTGFRQMIDDSDLFLAARKMMLMMVPIIQVTLKPELGHSFGWYLFSHSF